MGKASRSKQQRRESPVTITREPRFGSPERSVNVEIAEDSEDECVKVTIHGIDHLIHSTTALYLMAQLNMTLSQWESQGIQTAAAGKSEYGELAAKAIAGMIKQRMMLIETMASEFAEW